MGSLIGNYANVYRYDTSTSSWDSGYQFNGSTSFARSVGVSGDGNMVVAGGSGNVRVYKYIDSTWVLDHEFTGSTTDGFGRTKDISDKGNVVIVGTWDGNYVNVYRTDEVLDVSKPIQVDGSYITNINADNITSGTLDAARITIPDLDANKITSGTLSRPVNTTGNITTTSTGRIGIGTTNPNHPLHVESSVSATYGVNPAHGIWGHGYLAHNGAGSSAAGNALNYDLSIYAKESILTNDRVYASTAVYNSSDRRIKTNIIDVDDSECLETLRKFKPRKYNYKDTLKRGNSLMWGFVADEVEEIIPYSVVNITNIAGNICKIGTVSSSNIITFTDFNTSNLEVSNATSIIEVLDGGFKHHNVHLAEIIDDHTIRVEEDLTEWVFGVDDLGNAVDGNNIYVRGQEITNFKQLEYQAIWTVATSALQEVDRQQQADKVRISQLETQVAELISRMAALESS